MYTIRSLDGSLQDMLDPEFRKIQFPDEVAIVTVSMHLRALWTVKPPQPGSDEESNPMILAKTHTLTADHNGYEGLETNSDSASIDTAWRKAIAHIWNHVFVDVMRWLPEVNCSVGHFHPPSHELFAVGFPTNSDIEVDDGGRRSQFLSKKWDRNVLILPAYLGKGAVLRVTVSHDSQEEPPEKELGNFDGENVTEIWYLRAGVEINIHVEGAAERIEGGLAAVMAVGLLCSDSHGEKNSCEYHGDEEVSNTDDA